MDNERRIDTGDLYKRRLSLRATLRIARAGLERLQGDRVSPDQATVTELPMTPEQKSRSHHPAFDGDADQPRLSGKAMIAKLEAEGVIPTAPRSIENPDQVID